MQRRVGSCLSASAWLAVICCAAPAFAQNSDFNLSAHANNHATAKQIGLPEYPGATPWKDKDSDSSSADLGLVLNSFHVSVQVASYVTTDSPEQVLAFYRKPLAKYGEVLECDHGKPVGTLTVTKSGLTCGDDHGGKVSVNGTGDNDHELRAGTPEQYRMVGVDASVPGKTKFGLVALALPKGS
jgi:hypothetical protein